MMHEPRRDGQDFFVRSTNVNTGQRVRSKRGILGGVVPSLQRRSLGGHVSVDTHGPLAGGASLAESEARGHVSFRTAS